MSDRPSIHFNPPGITATSGTAPGYAGEGQFQQMLDFAADAILIADPQGRFVYANRQATTLLGYEPGHLCTLAIPDIVPPAQVEADMRLFAQLQAEGELCVEVEIRCADGVILTAELNAARLPDGNFYGSLRDIGARKRAELILRYQAFHDPLTGLPNRALFLDRLRQQLAFTRRRQTCLAVLFIDLDGFKRVNDDHDHAAGDRLLQDIGRRMQGVMRQSDTVARLGGDEFTALVSDLNGPDDASEVALKIHAALQKPLGLPGGIELVINASIGIALSPTHGIDPAALLRAADRAMYRAKRRGEGGYAFAGEP